MPFQSFAFRLLLILLIGVGVCAEGVRAQSGPPATRRDRPNILWIIAEDLGPHLGAYGTPEVRTPNLDRMAAQGMLFTNAFTTGAACSPSRSAFNTGMYQTTIGAHNHRSHRAGDRSPYPYPLPERVRVVSDWLRHAGYLTADIVHLPKEVTFRGASHTDWNFS